jgi:hypothetical protein
MKDLVTKLRELIDQNEDVGLDAVINECIELAKQSQHPPATVKGLSVEQAMEVVDEELWTARDRMDGGSSPTNEMMCAVGSISSRLSSLSTEGGEPVSDAERLVEQGPLYSFEPDGTDIRLSLYPDHDHDGGFYLSWMDGSERWSTKLGWADVLESLVNDYAPDEVTKRLRSQIKLARFKLSSINKKQG